MKSLFRTMRRKLLDEGRALRYLTYAIGEVVLIIVGILFALKINDWNEDRKEQVEFDEYIVQLREDVRTAIENLEEATRIFRRQKERIDFLPTFLELSEHKPDDLVKFEDGLNALGGYAELSIHIGLLGELLDGNKDILGRDPVLAQKFLKMEAPVEHRMGLMKGMYNQLDLFTAQLNQFRGKGRVTADVPPKYRLEELVSSSEFIYTSHSYANNLGSAVYNCERISQELESFLAVLEEYE